MRPEAGLARSAGVPQSEMLGQVLGTLEEASSVHVGQEFFRLLTRRLTASLNARGAFIVELLEGDRGRIVCLWNGVDFLEDEEYCVTADQRQRLLAGTGLFAPADLSEPDSPLRRLNAKSIATAPMFCRQGEVLGFAGTFYDQPVEDSADTLLMLRLVATRAGAELKRVQAERALLESEERYRRLVEASPDVIFRFRFHSGTVDVDYMNPAVERVLGYPPEDFYKNPQMLLDLLAPQDREIVQREVLGGNATPTATIRHFIRRDGKNVWAEVHNIPVYDERGNRVAQEGVARDVTARVLAEQALQERQRLQLAYLAAIPDTLFRMSADGSAVRRLGGEPDESSLGAIIPVDEVAGALEASARALRSGALQTFSYQIETDHETRAFELRFVPSGEGDLVGMLRDVTAAAWMRKEQRFRKAREDLEVRVERQIVHGNPYGLTFRELTVLNLVAEGATDKEIAQRLAISPFTASKHVSSIRAKLNVNSRTEASVKALDEGVITRTT